MLQSLVRYFLKTLSRAVVEKYQPKIIGITGSVGKTTTKEAILLVLSGKYKVRGNIKNYNNEIGLPLTILGSTSPGRSFLGWGNVIFKALKLLIDSAIYKIKQTRIKTVALEHRFEDPTVDNLEQLKIEVDDYFYSTEGITAEEYTAGSDFTYETIDENYYQDEL